MFLNTMKVSNVVLDALYEQNDKPSSVLDFIQQKLGAPSVSDYKKLQSEKSDLQIKYNEVFPKHQGTLRENFYMIGWNGNGVYRVLKIERLDASELNLSEDSTAYTKKECYELLKRIHTKEARPHAASNLSLSVMASLLLGPYYMLVITERREICKICGHRVYDVSKSEIISLRNSSVLCNIANSRDVNRHKRLLWMVDLTKDFFMIRSLQKNICDHESGGALYKKFFCVERVLDSENSKLSIEYHVDCSIGVWLL
ncbi:hypothetical protein Bca52824_029604 [Brassica carinata]|uniref:Uncharacterized protein n=1 Tax=Brassica carinata TaxID=52824 RepID=A0A8X7VEJ1_BRACI|nr:hypothetical protein Bca52824_029604 [Brassica carinata]